MRSLAVSNLKNNNTPSIRYHIDQIIHGGWPVLIRKLWRILVTLLLFPLTLPSVVVVRFLRPLVLVRFHSLGSEVMGIFAANTEMYLCHRDAGLDNQRTFDIFYHNESPCNQQLKKMWDRTLHVSCLGGPVDALNRIFPGASSHLIPEQSFHDRDVNGLLPRTPIHLFFTPEEERLGREKLQAISIPDGVPFVCFHSIDPQYKSIQYPDRDFYPHSHRTSSVHNHVPAAEEMTRRGYYAVRMGAIVKEPLNTANPMIVDYATKYRDDFLDIYLCAKCYFYIGDDSGLNRVATIFRRPLATVNQIPIEFVHTQGPNDLCIFKKLRLRKENRFLKFNEIFDRGIGNYMLAKQYEEAGIEPVENTPEEITALAVEMDERLKGTWRTTVEDEKLQERFWALFKPSIPERHGLIEARIGADFLRKNRELLD